MDLLIDGDIILFKMAFRHQKKVFDEIVADELEVAIEDMDEFIKSIRDATETKDYLICLTGRHNFRKDLDVTYKEFRKKFDPPVLLNGLRAHLEANYKTIQIPGIEADDIMGIYAREDPDKWIIASTDKDLDQIPGVHYNWMHRELYEITEEQGKLFFYEQVLSGDPSDGYRGVPGIGTKRAKKLIKKCIENDIEIWEAIVGAYEAKGLTLDDAILNARMAFILDPDHWDHEEQAVILWDPKESLEISKDTQDNT